MVGCHGRYSSIKAKALCAASGMIKGLWPYKQTVFIPCSLLKLDVGTQNTDMAGVGCTAVLMHAKLHFSLNLSHTQSGCRWRII